MQSQGKSLKGKVCLITGASRGIGAAIAHAAAEQGASIALNYNSSAEKAAELAAQIQGTQSSVLTVQADVGREDQVETMFDQIERELGKVDLLVNNAGMSLKALVTHTSTEQWDRVMDTNLKGAFLCCRRALPHMIRQRFGRIVNIASIWGLSGASCESVYAASKGGLIALTRSLAREVGPSGITVNAIAPGPIDTDMLSSELDQQERLDLARDIPIGRLGCPEEIGDACVYFMQNRASLINGQVLVMDGGWISW